MRDLIWVARFPDGSTLHELELLPGGRWRETPWQEVYRRRERLSWFGLEGASLSLGFRCQDGIFEINRQPLEVWIELADGNRLRWTHQPVPYGRFLDHFKQAHSDAKVPLYLADGRLWQEPVRPGRTNLDAYWAGYGLRMTDPFGGTWAVRVGWWVPASDEPIEFRLDFVRSIPLEGQLVAEIHGQRRIWPVEQKPGEEVRLRVEVRTDARLA